MLDLADRVPLDPVAAFLWDQVGVSRLDQAVDVQSDPVAVFQLDQVVASRLDPVAAFQLDQVVASRLDQAVDVQSDPVAVFQLDQVAAFLWVQILGVPSLFRDTNVLDQLQTLHLSGRSAKQSLDLVTPLK